MYLRTKVCSRTQFLFYRSSYHESTTHPGSTLLLFKCQGPQLFSVQFPKISTQVSLLKPNIYILFASPSFFILPLSLLSLTLPLYDIQRIAGSTWDMPVCCWWRDGAPTR